MPAKPGITPEQFTAPPLSGQALAHRPFFPVRPHVAALAAPLSSLELELIAYIAGHITHSIYMLLDGLVSVL